MWFISLDHNMSEREPWSSIGKVGSRVPVSWQIQEHLETLGSFAPTRRKEFKAAFFGHFTVKVCACVPLLHTRWVCLHSWLLKWLLQKCALKQTPCKTYFIYSSFCITFYINSLPFPMFSFMEQFVVLNSKINRCYFKSQTNMLLAEFESSFS